MTFFVQLFIHILYLINSHKCVSFYLVLKLSSAGDRTSVILSYHRLCFYGIMTA